MHRYDFVYYFDVADGNPNGDPDAGNLPRVDPQTGHGLVTDVCLKRKIRNFVSITKNYDRPFDVYVKERAVLGRSHTEAFQTLGITLGEEIRKAISAADADALEERGMPEGMSIERDADDKAELVLSTDLDKKFAQNWIKENKPSPSIKKLLSAALKDSKGRKPTQDETDAGRAWLCKNFFDIRTFGAVLSLKSAPNCGQVRGPVQMTFARSIEPIVALEHSITRMAVATEAEAQKQSGDNRTMGRKYSIPYALYRCHGFINPFLAKKTGFSDDDLDLFKAALGQMFEYDRSASRGLMSPRACFAFKHESPLGNARADELFARVACRESIGNQNGHDAPRGFDNYELVCDESDLPNGVTVERWV